MSEIVPAAEIERIVGAKRHATEHLGRAIEAEQTIYILHSQECKDSGIDLRDCDYSLALDAGINEANWVSARAEGCPVRLMVHAGRLVPSGRAS